MKNLIFCFSLVTLLVVSCDQGQDDGIFLQETISECIGCEESFGEVLNFIDHVQSRSRDQMEEVIYHFEMADKSDNFEERRNEVLGAFSVIDYRGQRDLEKAFSFVLDENPGLDANELYILWEDYYSKNTLQYRADCDGVAAGAFTAALAVVSCAGCVSGVLVSCPGCAWSLGSTWLSFSTAWHNGCFS